MQSTIIKREELRIKLLKGGLWKKIRTPIRRTASVLMNTLETEIGKGKKCQLNW